MLFEAEDQDHTPDDGSVAIKVDGKEARRSSRLDLTSLPPFYVLATHLSIDEQHEVEELLSNHGATLTYDICEAKIVLANVSRAQRARLELRWKGLTLENVQANDANQQEHTSNSEGKRPAKRRRTLGYDQDTRTGRAVVSIDHDSSSTSEGTDEETRNDHSISGSECKKGGNRSQLQDVLPPLMQTSLVVVKLEWLNAAVNLDELISMKPFIILNAQVSPVEKTNVSLITHTSSDKANSVKETHVEPINFNTHHYDSTSIMERAKADPKPRPVFTRFRRRDRVAEAAKPDIMGKTFSTSQVPQLLRQSTSEDNEFRGSDLPPMPDWVLQNKTYSCERSSPLNSPNADFIQLLKRIRLARELTLDEIGVRAYSTSIASLSAYPHRIQSSREVHALPGCDAKIAHLFHEYNTTGQLQAVRDIDADPALTSLQAFHEIWGVGAVTAREFYYEKGWRELDDIIEYGWKSLSCVQQIGLKFYDDFQVKLTRAEVEAIAATITRHAVHLTNDGVQTTLVGGYRRGQELSSDVDIIITHPDESQTLNLIPKLVASLEAENYITHTLTLNLTTTHRDQTTLPIHPMKGGHGFDTLDKALVVWQNPYHHHHQPAAAAPQTVTPKAPTPPTTKNPHPHHRVDIIISPYRTIGCAIAGWTSGTTFQRDLRRYCKHRRGWKFDSSGVRERGGGGSSAGSWIDLEGWRDEETRCTSWQEAERRVFAGLGLEWVEPWERCTG